MAHPSLHRRRSQCWCCGWWCDLEWWCVLNWGDMTWQVPIPTPVKTRTCGHRYGFHMGVGAGRGRILQKVFWTLENTRRALSQTNLRISPDVYKALASDVSYLAGSKQRKQPEQYGGWEDEDWRSNNKPSMMHNTHGNSFQQHGVVLGNVTAAMAGYWTWSTPHATKAADIALKCDNQLSHQEYQKDQRLSMPINTIMTCRDTTATQNNNITTITQCKRPTWKHNYYVLSH